MSKVYPLVLLAVVLAIYGFTIGHDYNIDDGFYLQTMPADGSSFGETISVFEKDKLFSEVDYRPMTAFFLTLEQFFFGRSPLVFHLFNLVYYWLLGICLYLVFMRFGIFEKEWHLLLFTCIFLLHPSHANVVASIKNRDVVMAAMFALIGVVFLYKFFTSDRKWAFRFIYLLAAIFWGYVTAVTKTDGIFLFLIPPLVVFFKRERITRVVLATVVSIAAIMTVRAFQSTNLIEVDQSMTELLLARFSNPLAGTSDLSAILAMQGKAFWQYLGFQIIPTNYHFYFGFDMMPVNGFANLPFIGGMASSVFLAVIAILFYWKRAQTLAGLGIAIFLALTLPYLVFIHEIAGIVAVRYGFYGSIGFSLALSALLIHLYKKNDRAGTAVISLVCLLFAFFTIFRAMDWKDHITLYTRDIPKLERSYVANRMVGEWYLNEIEFHSDPHYLDELLRMSKKYTAQAIGLYGEDPVTLKRMGEIYTYENNADSAFFYYATALELDPDRSTSWASMAQFAIQTGNHELLEMAAEGMLGLDSLSPDGIALMNDALYNQGAFEQVLEFNRRIIDLDDSMYLTYLYTAKVYEDRGDRLNALINYFEAFERGFVDNRLQSSLINFVLSRDLKEVSDAFPSYFP